MDVSQQATGANFRSCMISSATASVLSNMHTAVEPRAACLRVLSMCVAQVYWTKEVGEAITTEGFKGLAKYGEKCTAELNKIVSLVRGQLTSLERATCGALVVIDVHARDVTVQVGIPTQPSHFLHCSCSMPTHSCSSPSNL